MNFIRNGFRKQGSMPNGQHPAMQQTTLETKKEVIKESCLHQRNSSNLEMFMVAEEGTKNSAKQ